MTLTLRPPVALLTLVALLAAGAFSSLPAAHPVDVSRVASPARDLAAALERLHLRAEGRRAGAGPREKILFSYLHHLATDAQSLSTAAAPGSMTHSALLEHLSHLEGWFRWTEGTLTQSALRAYLWDDWVRVRRQFNQVASIAAPQQARDEDEPARTRRLSATVDEQLRVPGDFKRVVESETRAGSVPDPAHVTP